MDINSKDHKCGACQIHLMNEKHECLGCGKDEFDGCDCKPKAIVKSDGIYTLVSNTLGKLIPRIDLSRPRAKPAGVE